MALSIRLTDTGLGVRAELDDHDTQLAQIENYTSQFDGIKHRALVIPTIHNTYSYQPFDQLRNQGIMVQVTSIEYFTRNIEILIDAFDVLILNQGAGVIDRVWMLNHLSRVTAQQVAAAFAMWRSSGKKIVYSFFDASGKAEMKKHNIDGAAVETVDLQTILFKTNVTTGTIAAGTGTFTKTADCPLTDEEIFDLRWLNYSSRNIYPRNRTGTYGLVAGEEVLVENVLGETKEVYVYWKPYEYCCALYGGVITNQNLESPAYKYINIGSLARLLIGNESPIRLAMDCIYSRKVAATGYDNDLTTDLVAVDGLVQAHNGRPLEMGLVSYKLTADIASAYRGLGRNVALCSHSKYHYNPTDGTVTAVNEAYVIPASRVIQLKRPYRVINMTVKIGATTLAAKDFIAVITDAQYGYDPVRELLKFTAANVGATVLVTYTYLKEAEEWVGSLRELEAYGSLTDDVIYLTGGEYAMHGTTQALLDKRDVIVCNYSLPNQWAWVAAQQGYGPIFSPYLADDVSGGFEAWHLLVDSGYSQTEIEAIDGKVKESIDNANSRKHPFIWYSHDFSFSNEVNGLCNKVGVDASWKGATYEESRQKLIAGLKWFMDRLDEENVYWMARSQYHRRYRNFNRDFVYNIVSDGNTHYVYLQNMGKNFLGGVTFRSSTTIVSAKQMPNKDLPVTVYAGDNLVSFDVAPGEKMVLEIIVS